jgi:hypothetical protein
MVKAGSDEGTPNRHFIKAYRYPSEAAEGEDHGDAIHDTVATYRFCKAASNGRIREGKWHIPRICQAGDKITM